MFPISEKFIQNQIDKGKCLIDSHEVIFFDVFDTLLTRDCANPSDVFLLIEQRFNEITTSSPLHDFKQLRQDAEKFCAEKIFAPNLDEIYSYMPLTNEQKSVLKALEIEIEQSISTKKYTGYILYQYAKKIGKKIVAVSDMYLGATLIGKMLNLNGYSIDSIVVSCDYRAEKFNGKLFQIAIAKEAFGKKDIVHFGDSVLSDIVGAKRAGIECLWLPARKNLSYFRKCGDFFADTYLYPFIANRVPLIENKLTALGYETCGPMIVGFCQWLHEKLHDGGYKKALFCARDMLQTYQIYLKLYPDDKELACYFYVSRKSLQPAYDAVVNPEASNESLQQLNYLMDYLSKFGCKGKTAFIDSGLNGRSQKMLTTILNGRIKLHGFYMRVAKVFFENVSGSDASIYMYSGHPNIKHMIGSMFFETMIAAVHGRTIGYTKDGKVIKPVFGKPHPYSRKIIDYQKGVNVFVKDYNDYLVNASINEKAVRDVMLRLSFFPQFEDMKLLLDLKCGNEEYEQMIIQKKRRVYIFSVIDFFRDLKKTYWKGGFLRFVFPKLSPIVGRLYLAADSFILCFIGEWNNPQEPK